MAMQGSQRTGYDKLVTHQSVQETPTREPTCESRSHRSLETCLISWPYFGPGDAQRDWPIHRLHGSAVI